MNTLAERIASREATVAVVGLGYVGLPLAIAIANAGFRTAGIDRDQAKVRQLQRGHSYISDVAPAELLQALGSGRLTASASFDEASRADVAVIAVPTPIDEYRNPDLSHVADAASHLAGVMRPPALVVLESTTYPGATEDVVGSAFRSAGFTLGRELFLGYSPERIDPGNETWNVTNTPKIVAGLSPECAALVAIFYRAFVDRLVPVSSLQTAEAAKLFENTFRMVNIALVNEFRIICDAFGIDVWEALAACKTKPYGFMPFEPGPGLGGHCIPVDPFYLAWKARGKRVSTEFIELAGRINDAMPAYVVGRVGEALNARRRAINGSRIAVLGVAYKRNSADLRESPAIRIVELLRAAGATVTYHDPHVATLSTDGDELTSESLTAEYLRVQDCAVLVTDHDAVDWTLVARSVPTIVDTRNVLARHVGAPRARETSNGDLGIRLTLTEELETA